MKLKISKNQWEKIGKKARWIKIAQDYTMRQEDPKQLANQGLKGGDLDQSLRALNVFASINVNAQLQQISNIIGELEEKLNLGDTGLENDVNSRMIQAIEETADYKLLVNMNIIGSIDQLDINNISNQIAEVNKQIQANQTRQNPNGPK